MSFNSPGGSTNTSQRSTSTVRSRTRRLVSFNDSEDDDNTRPLQSSGLSTMMLSPDLPAVRSRGTTPSPYGSRGASPLPMRHPSRATELPNRDGSNGIGASLGLFSHTGKGQVKFTESSRAAVDFLDASWSSLQNLASSVLGSDIAQPASNGTARTHSRKPSRPDPLMRNTSKTPSTWGPSASSASEIGAGTEEERQALVQAKKREALLLADPILDLGRNTRHKRRDSSDQTSYSAADPEQDEDALAYIHHVQPTDSITGVTIKYGCQSAIFRKANGFWPSDSIQSRKTVLLPVDSCSVKGRPIQSKAEIDLLGHGDTDHGFLEDLSGSSMAETSLRESSTDTAEIEGDRVWKHESWVRIDGFFAPVEIGRVPRRALGFFPRTRRKSVSYTDSEAPSSISDWQSTTPMSSSTISPIESQSTPSTTPQARTQADPSGSRTQSNFKPSPRHQRQRSSVHLLGRGVGTLDRNAMAPGPALDGLSKFVAQHLPNLTPEANPANFDRTISGSSSTAASNTSNGLENLGGAFEGWVRKMTTRAKSSLNDLQQSAQSYQINALGSGTGDRRMGDLIELNDGLESRGPSSHPAESQRKSKFGQTGLNVHDGSSLRGRFPSPSSSGTSRTRTGGIGMGYGDRAKDD